MRWARHDICAVATNGVQVTFFALVCRGLLGGVFGVAGVAKLRERTTFRRRIAVSRALRRWAAVITWAVPTIELAIAIGLLVSPTARTAGAAAAMLLVAFLVYLTFDASATEADGCFCFGQTGGTTSRRAAAVRNVGLAATAIGIAVTADVGSSAGAAAVAGGTAVVLTARSRRGRRLPATLPGFDGTTIHLDTVPRPVLLVFMDADCPPCARLLPRLAGWRHRVALREVDARAVPMRVAATPSACVVHGRRMADLVSGEAAIEALVDRLAPAPRSAEPAARLLLYAMTTDELVEELMAHLTRFGVGTDCWPTPVTLVGDVPPPPGVERADGDARAFRTPAAVLVDARGVPTIAPVEGALAVRRFVLSLAPDALLLAGRDA